MGDQTLIYLQFRYSFLNIENPILGIWEIETVSVISMPSMQIWECPTQIGNLKSLSSMNKISIFII